MRYKWADTKKAVIGQVLSAWKTGDVDTIRAFLTRDVELASALSGRKRNSERSQGRDGIHPRTESLVNG